MTEMHLALPRDMNRVRREMAREGLGDRKNRGERLWRSIKKNLDFSLPLIADE